MKRNRDGGARANMVVDAALLAAAILFGMHAVLIVLPTVESQGKYEEIAATQRGGGNTIDWQALRMQNPDIAAWVTVDGTSINHPVVEPGDGRAEDWYLAHDFWNNASPLGCPYLDSRSSPDGDHALVYGHYLEHSSQMFSDIHLAYNQASFDQIGNARWFTPKYGVVTFTPTLALEVDRRYAPIQHFMFNSGSELSKWLLDLKNDAHAVSRSFDSLLTEATRALTLATCSSSRPGEQHRTLLVFVS